MPLILQRPLVVFDIEATGMQLGRDRIVEMSLLKISPDGNREMKTYRLDPGMPMPEEVIPIHGIRDEDVAGCPSFADIAVELRDWLEGCDLAGYNSNRFDVPMLVEEFLRADVGFEENRRYVDVQRIFMRMEQRTLEAAYKFFCDKELASAHNAAADTEATWEVLLAQIDRYEGKIGEDVEALAEFSKDADFVDFGRRMIYKNGVEVFHFGKHRGRPVEEVFEEEPSYYDWMQKGNFLLHTKLKLKYIWLRMKSRKSR